MLTLGLLVASLTATTLLQSQVPAEAAQVAPSTSLPTTPTNASIVAMSIADLNVARSARTVDDRAAQQVAQDRRHQRRVKKQRQERRADAKAEARAARRLEIWGLPVAGAGWSAWFGESGSAWSSGYHTGQDFTAPSGTPVRAVGPGTITSARWSDAYGNIITITHPGGDESWYAHMSAFERTSGAVRAGDIIGYVGCTGNCYGNHVHLEYHPGGGDAADPLPWLRGHGAY